MKIQVKYYFYIYFNFFNIERHRRSKHEQEGRIFGCQCGKAFLSKPALNNHIKTKHPETLEGQIKLGRGRPRKYPPKIISDFESTKYNDFFNSPYRQAEDGKTLIKAFEDQKVSQIAWSKYGFRVGVTGGNYDVSKTGIKGIPSEMKSVTSGLKMEYYDRVINCLSGKGECK